MVLPAVTMNAPVMTNPWSAPYRPRLDDSKSKVGTPEAEEPEEDEPKTKIKKASAKKAPTAKKSKDDPKATTDKDLTKRTRPAVQTVAKADGGLSSSSKKAEPVQYHLFFMEERVRIVKENPSFKLAEIGKSLVLTRGKLSFTEKTAYKVGVETQPAVLA